eukprot:UN29803
MDFVSEAKKSLEIFEEYANMNTYISGMLCNQPVNNRKLKPQATIVAGQMKKMRSEELAKLLTKITGTFFSKIHNGEIMEANWKKKRTNKITSPNVLELLRHINAVAAWTQGCVLDAQDLESRKTILKKLIRVAEICWHHHRDLCTAGAIIMGLNTQNVWCLKFAWKGVDHNRWSVFCHMKGILIAGRNGSSECERLHEMFAEECDNGGYALPYFSWIGDQIYRICLDKSNKAGILNERKFVRMIRMVEMSP